MTLFCRGWIKGTFTRLASTDTYSGASKTKSISLAILLSTWRWSLGELYYNYKQELTAIPSHPTPLQLHKLLHPNSYKASLFTLCQEVPISFNSFLKTSSHLLSGRTRFLFDPHSWPQGRSLTSFNHLSFSTCPSYFNLFLIFALKGGVEWHLGNEEMRIKIQLVYS